MTLFRSNTHQEIWRQRWCETCFQPEEAQRRLMGKDAVCPIWEKAMRTNRKPVEWDRKPRATDMDRTIKCNEHTPKPPIKRRPGFGMKVAGGGPLDVPLFDVTPYKTDVGFVPVEGWPNKPGAEGTDHA